MINNQRNINKDLFKTFFFNYLLKINYAYF